MRKVVQGPDNRSRGLVSRSIQKTGQVDRNRNFNLPRCIPRDKQAYMLWDFVLTRDDESEVSLHPSLSKNKVECIYWVGGTDREVPKTDLDGSSGPGTFKRVKSEGVHETLKLDSKYPRRQTLQSRSSVETNSFIEDRRQAFVEAKKRQLRLSICSCSSVCSYASSSSST